MKDNPFFTFFYCLIPLQLFILSRLIDLHLFIDFQTLNNAARINLGIYTIKKSKSYLGAVTK